MFVSGSTAGEREVGLDPLNDVWMDALDCYIIETRQQKNMPLEDAARLTFSQQHVLF